MNPTNIGDLHLFFEIFVCFFSVDVYELPFQTEYFPSKFGQSVSEESLLGEKSVLTFGNTVSVNRNIISTTLKSVVFGHI